MPGDVLSSSPFLGSSLLRKDVALRERSNHVSLTRSRHSGAGCGEAHLEPAPAWREAESLSELAPMSLAQGGPPRI